MSHLQALWGLAMHGSRRLQQAPAQARWAAAFGIRLMSTLPEYVVLGVPALSPTMTQGNLAKWHVKVGDKVSAGTLLADIETDKATMGFENQDDGHVAKLLVSEGASNLPLGTPLLVLVEDESSIPAFANFTGKAAGAPAAAAAPIPAASPPPRPAASIKSASAFPPHQILGMPSLSPTGDKGNVVSWAVKVGDTIKAGDVLGDIETDKATVGFENQDEGVVAKILVPAGTNDVPINTPLLIIVEDASLVPAFKDYVAPGATVAAAPAAPAAAPAVTPSKPKVVANVRLGPAARMLLEEAGLSVSDVTPSGPNDIVTKGDVLAAIAAGVKPGSGAAKSSAPAAAAPVTAAPAATKPAAPVLGGAKGKATYEDIPNTQIRKVIASRLLESKITIPSLYGAVDVELDALTVLRKGLAEQGVKLSVNDFVLKAIAAALKEVPAANSLWDSKKQEPVPASAIDISVAVATERGLITPIVKNADNKTLSQISKDVKELAAKAKANKLKPEEFQGGSFTVSNLGMYGVSYFSAIINPPQGAILAVGGSQPRVRLVGGKPKAYNVMTVTLSADHRMYDGELLGAVLESFKKHIQNPATLVM